MAAAFEFAQFRVDAARRVLLRGESEVALSRKAFDTLLVLLEERGKLVPKEVLLQRVWPDTFVEENSLNQSISAIRKVLGSKFIETVAGHGYRFVAPMVEHAAPARETPRSLAILPLRNLGAEEGDWLGIGIADTLITRLSNVHDLAVRPTSAVLRLGDRGAVETGRTLAVDAVLEGSIRKSGDRLRATVQLVSVATGAPIWARTFDERFTEIFAVEDAIAERVAAALTSRLSGEERSHLTRRTTDNSEAYRLYLNGRWYSERLTRDSLTKALELLQQAVGLDPRYALGYAGLAYHYLQCADLTMPSLEAMNRAEDTAGCALALDDSLVDAHVAVAGVRWFRDWDVQASSREFERALSIDPRSVSARQLYGWCLTLAGEFEHALRMLNEAVEISPFEPSHALYHAPVLYFSRRYDESLAVTRALLERDPDHWLTHVIAGRAHEAKGDLSAAIACYEESRRIDDSVPESLGDLARAYGRSGRSHTILDELQRYDHVPAFVLANVHLGLGDRDRTFELLNAAIEERSWYVTWYRVDPQLDELRGDERFARLLTPPARVPDRSSSSPR